MTTLQATLRNIRSALTRVMRPSAAQSATFRLLQATGTMARRLVVISHAHEAADLRPRDPRGRPESGVHLDRRLRLGYNAPPGASIGGNCAFPPIR
jgi:hypothetical protein